VTDFSVQLTQHFHDHEVDHAPYEKPHLSLYQLLQAIAVQSNANNLPPNLAGETMRAMLTGLPYPVLLLHMAIQRTYAERRVSYARAALIKACINRRGRYQHPGSNDELMVSLDTDNNNTAYRLGRLLSILERIQAEACSKLPNTIRGRFYCAASTTPFTAFVILIKLSTPLLGRINNNRRAIILKKWRDDILDGLCEFPRHLCIDDQGRFAVGYYQQKHIFINWN
jgi:CRISPR-associated protein Csd1